MAGKERSLFTGLYEAAKAINSTLVLGEVLNSIGESTTKALGAKGCSLMLLSPDRSQLLHSAAYGLSDWYVRKGPVKADTSIAEALGGKAVAVFDAIADPRVQYREQAKKEGIASILSYPLRLRGQIIGVMRVYTGTRHRFSPTEIAFVGAVSDLGAIAIENAKLYESLKRSYDDVRKDLLASYPTWGMEHAADMLAAVPQE